MPKVDGRSRTHTRARWSTPESAISSSTWTSANASPAAGTLCALCECFAGRAIVTVRDVWNGARSARTACAAVAGRGLRRGGNVRQGELCIQRRVVAERLGHATLNVTLNVYSHVTPTMQREAAAALDADLAR